MTRVRAWAARQRSAIVLVAIVTCVSGSSLLWNAHQQGAWQAAQRRDQVTAQRAGEAVEAKLCTTLARLAARNPPPGDPAGNPSRAYLQWQHDTLAELGPDIGCKQRRTP